MPIKKMHADEVETDPALVRRLLDLQFPQWADLLIEQVPLRQSWMTIVLKSEGE